MSQRSSPGPRPWSVLRSELVLSRAWLEVREQHVRLANGHEIEQFHVISGPPWVGVVCLSSGGELVLVRQYRHGIRAASTELPAGVIEPGEPPLVAAQRELREETGFVAEDWQPLIEVAPEPVRATQRAQFFCARNARLAQAPELDASEDIEVLCVTPQAALSLIDSGEITHGVHIGALLLAARRGYF